ncbi:MAG: hypothetical protein ABIX01_20760 [Chitinophagaceae bacterium]
MKKTTCLFFCASLWVGLQAQGLCEEANFYFQQLTINCRNIAGKVIPAVKEHITTKVISGMQYGQCSGVQNYTNEFVKFYSQKFDTPEAADSLFQQFKSQLSVCMKAESFTIESQATIDDGDKLIRWAKAIGKITKTVVLDLKPDPDGGFIVTLEFILS